METKEQIRNSIYEYIDTNVGTLDSNHRTFIKKAILKHEGADSKNNIGNGRRITKLNNKLEQYIKKAKKLNSPKANLQAEGLEMCLNWLNQDDE